MSYLGAIGAGVGALGSLYGLFNNNTPQAPAPAYTPQNLPGADASAYGAIQGLPGYNSAGSTLGAYGSITNNLVNNPYGSQYQRGAGITGAAGVGAGANILGASQSFLPYAQQTLQTGFDPQNALYNQQFQLQTDQDRAGQAARGIATTPYGAGVENKANSDFNIAWQNAQLGRQAQAGQTASGLLGAAGSGTTTGLNTMLQGYGLPYSTYNTIGQNQQGALNAYGAYGGLATSTGNIQISDLLQYLGLGNQSAAVNNQNYANQITAQNNQFNQQQTLGKNLGSSISGLGPLFGQPATGQAGLGGASGGLRTS